MPSSRTSALIRSQPGLAPEFTLEVTSVIGILDDNGTLAYRASLLDLMPQEPVPATPGRGCIPSWSAA
jgi:hypothetical protein